jgi:hypothetical protein
VKMGMMDWDRFEKLLEDPMQVGIADIDYLREVCESYPFFSAAQALYAKALKEDEGFGYPRQLRRAALAFGNRKELFRWLEERPLPNLENEQNEPSADMDFSVVPPPPVDHKRKDLLTILQEQLKEIRQKELKRSVDGKAQLSKDGSQREDFQPREEEPEESKEEYLARLRRKLNPSEAFSVGENPTESIPPSVPEEPWAFNPVVDVLLYEGLPEESGESLLSGNVRKSGEPVSGSHSFEEWLGLVSSSTGASLGEAPSNKVLRNFPITRNPMVEGKPGKGSTYLPDSGMTEVNLSPENDMMTETLAKIYADQKHFAKAIEVYENLCLKYPQKKLFFAARIEALKLLLNKK